MKKHLTAVFTAAILIAASVAPSFALGPHSGMPREPITKAGQCAKANQGYHIPYRGWRTKNRLGYLTCMWY